MWTHIFCKKHWAKLVDPRFFFKEMVSKTSDYEMAWPQLWTHRECEIFSVWLHYKVQRTLKTKSLFDFWWVLYFFRLRKQFIDRMMSNYYRGREAAYAANTKILLYLKMLDFQQILTSQIFPEHYSQRTCQKPWPIFTLHHHQEWCSHLHHHGNEAVIGLYFPIQPSGVFTTDKIDLKIPRWWWWSKSFQFTHSENL